MMNENAILVIGLGIMALGVLGFAVIAVCQHRSNLRPWYDDQILPHIKCTIRPPAGIIKPASTTRAEKPQPPVNVLVRNDDTKARQRPKPPQNHNLCPHRPCCRWWDCHEAKKDTKKNE